jgi:hypothetical protein
MEQLESYCLSDKDIKKILRNVNIVIYPQLKRYNNILECFKHNNIFVLFFEEEKIGKQISGHWSGFIKNDSDKTILYFDPYGLKPDECKDWLKKNTLVSLKEYPNYLSELLEKSDYTIKYNPIQYQSKKPNNNECGDHTCTRLLHANLNGQQYKSFLDGLKRKYNVATYDLAVVEYIYTNYKI